MPSTDAPIFVTGGSGFVGRRLVEMLVAAGRPVRALARSDAAAAMLAALGAEPVRGDLADAASLRASLPGCRTVFHVAALFELWGHVKEFRRVNVEGTRLLVRAAREAGVQRFVQVGAAAVVMGQPEPILRANERLPLRKADWAPYAASKAEAEHLVLSANAPGFATLVLRPPMIWGCGMPMLDHMIETVRRGRFQWVGDGRQAMSTCHVDNLCHALLLAETRGGAGEAYFIADAEDGTLKSVITTLLATRGVTPPDKRVPFAVAWRMARLFETVWRTFRLRGAPPITRQMLRLIGKPFTVDTSKARRDLGYAPLVTWNAGIAAIRGPIHP